MTAKLSLFLCALGAVAGCHPSTRVIPNRPSGISETTVNGNLVYVRGGQQIGHGFFGGGLEEAVAGNSEAEEEARMYFRRNVAAQLLWIASAGLLVNAFVFGYEREPGSGPGGELTTTGNVLLGLSVFSLTGGSLFYRSGQAHRYDAINIYNNAVESP